METSVPFAVRSDGIAVLTIDQPGAKVNVLTQQLWMDLEATIDAISARTDVKGLVIASGKPGVFIAGADLKLLGDAIGPNDPAVRAFIEQGLRVLAKLEALPFPTCAAIDGVALGGGLEVALACDLRIVGSHPRIQLGLPEVKLGLIPGWGGTQRLPRIVGLPTAMKMLATGEPLSRDEAIACGLVLGTTLPAIEVACAEVQNVNWSEVRDRKTQPMPASSSTPVDSDFVAVRGSMLPLSEGIALETAAFLQLAGSAESKRLIAEFFAARRK